MIKRALLLLLAVGCFLWAAWSVYRMMFVPNEYQLREWIVSIGIEIGLGILLVSWAKDGNR